MEMQRDLDEVLDDEICTNRTCLKNPLYVTDVHNTGAHFEVTESDEVECNGDLDYAQKFKDLYKVMTSTVRSTFSENLVACYAEYAKTMDDISPRLDRSVVKKVICAGSGDRAVIGKVVKFHYNLWMEYADEPFDSSQLHSLQRCKRAKLGTQHLIPGVEVGLLSMTVDELAEFIIQGPYAFGSSGCIISESFKVPPNCAIRAEIELLFVGDDEDPIDSMGLTERECLSLQQVKEYCLSKKKLANAYFNKRKYASACNRYKVARDLMDLFTAIPTYYGDPEFKKLLHTLLSNMAMCYIHLSLIGKAIASCERADLIMPGDKKVLYRWACALYAKKEYDSAMEKAKLAKSRLSDTDPLLENLISGIDEAIKLQKLKDKEQSMRMFSKCMNGTSTPAPISNTPALSSDKSACAVLKQGSPKYGNVLDCPETFRKHVSELMFKFDQDKIKEMDLEGSYSVQEIYYMQYIASQLGYSVAFDSASSQLKLRRD